MIKISTQNTFCKVEFHQSSDFVSDTDTKITLTDVCNAIGYTDCSGLITRPFKIGDKVFYMFSDEGFVENCLNANVIASSLFFIACKQMGVYIKNLEPVYGDVLIACHNDKGDIVGVDEAGIELLKGICPLIEI